MGKNKFKSEIYMTGMSMRRLFQNIMGKIQGDRNQIMNMLK